MNYCLLLIFLFSTIASSAQHEQHKMPETNNEQNRSEQRPLRRIGPVVEYHLYVKDTTVNFTGHRRKALAINGQIPAPTLKFTEGDSAVIHVHNLLNGEVSIHWHGVLLPNEEDGVHVLNTPPIHAKHTHTFRFRIIQNGTLWYHSHTKFQEQEGLYGPLIFYPADRQNENKMNEEVLQISDWRDERGRSIMRSLKRRNEWYAIKKRSVQSWGEAIATGHFGDKVQMEWTRMPGADVSDVYYPVQLMHGQPVRTFAKYKKADSVRLRIINGSAASYYWLQFAGGKMKVVAADGNDVKPVEVDKLLIATAETFDVIIKIPGDGQYEFRATAQDITKHSSAFFGAGPQVKTKDIPPLDYMVLMNEMNKMTWMMKGMGMKMKMGLFMKMDMSSMNMQGMDHDGMQDSMKDMDQTREMPMDKKMDTAAMKKDIDSMQHDHKQMSDTIRHDMDSMKMKKTDDHKMHEIKKAPKKASVSPKKTTTKKGATPAKKPAPKKKPDPKKKQTMEGMDHSKHGGMSYNSGEHRNLFTQFVKYSGLEQTDTIADKSKAESIPGHDMYSVDNMKMDTVPKNKQQHADHQAMQHGNMKKMQHDKTNMGGMQKDTSRSYMLQTMMPKMPMTGFDFPPGNGKDIVLSYDMLVSDSGSTLLPKKRPWREIEITLSGNMQRFVWSINGKTLSQQDMKFKIRKGENIRVVFTNATMMEHPIHLHGHFFRVINEQGAYAPMKHTFNINAMHMQVIEFAATEEKDWFLHCHTLYHMIGGMATIFSYEGTQSAVQQAYPREFQKFKREHGSLVFPWANASFHSQGTFGTIVLSGLRFQLDQDWKWNYKKSYELETRMQYFLDKRQFFSVYIGGEYEKNDMQNGKKVPVREKEQIGTAGLIYTLPFLINVEGRIDHRGNFRIEVQREDIPLTTRTRLDFYWNTDKEYGVNARYIIAKYLAVSANYDSDYGWGAGLSIIY